MSKSEPKKCPKCGEEMVEAETLIPKVTVYPKKGHLLGDSIIPTYCKNCGFIELYKEEKKKITI